MIVLKIQAGSHLYGYATPSSDIDFFEVHTEGFIRPNDKHQIVREAEQTIVEGIDVTRMTLTHFMLKAAKGAHQALDAMFASDPLVDTISAFRKAYRAGYEVIPTYQDAIHQFATREGDPFRYQRHALRLTYNLIDIMKQGYYTPELTQTQISTLNELALLPSEKFRKELTRISPVEVL